MVRASAGTEMNPLHHQLDRCAKSNAFLASCWTVLMHRQRRRYAHVDQSLHRCPAILDLDLDHTHFVLSVPLADCHGNLVNGVTALRHSTST